MLARNSPGAGKRGKVLAILCLIGSIEGRLLEKPERGRGRVSDR